MACYSITALSLFILFTHVSLASGPYHSIVDLWNGELGDLTDSVSLSPNLGGRNGYQCCLKALNQSLTIEDGNVVFQSGQTSLRGTIPELLSYPNPCTASYNGSDGNQPQVIVSYTWCSQECPGWERTNTKHPSEWLQPLIAFILPTIVFCFSIPRRRRIIIPPWLFPYNRLVEFPGNLTLVYKIPASVTLLVLDAVIWALTSIVVAGPMIISGCLERMFDARLLQFLSAPRYQKIISTQLRGRILLIILTGNLDVESTWRYSDSLVKPLDEASFSTHPTASPARTLQKDDSDPHPGRSPSSQATDDGEEDNKTVEGTVLRPLPLKIPELQIVGETNSTTTPIDQRHITDIHLQGIKSKLSSLLESQPTFGSSVGIGVLFYTSSFVYSVMEIRQNYGDSSTSHSLAFGIFWMIVGHVAVVSAILLAGNNPSAFEALASEPIGLAQPNVLPDKWKNRVSRRRSSVQAKVKTWVESSIQRRRFALPAGLKQYLYRTSFASKFKSAWMWNRGLYKALWISQMVENHPQLRDLQTSVLHVHWAIWVSQMILPTLMLIVLPSILGGMVSYTTPTIGLSCRSMIPVLYTCSQLILVLLWVWDWRHWKTTRAGNFVTAKELRSQRTSVLSALDIAWYGLFILSITTAVFTAFGGTIFHLMGLFQNCLCLIPIWQWSRRYSPTSTTYMGGNSSEQIYYAKRYWLPLGIAATVLLLVTTYFGWQYQHRLRREFVNQVELLGSETSNRSLNNPGTSSVKHSNASSVDDHSLLSETTVHQI